MTHSNTEQPKNSITLMNGAVLECFPKESHQDDFVPDKMKLDATGTYLRIGNKPCNPYQEQQKTWSNRRNSSQTMLSIYWHIVSESCMTAECFLLLLPFKMYSLIQEHQVFTHQLWAYTWSGGMNVP